MPAQKSFTRLDSGADLLAAREARERALVVQAEDLDLDPRPREPLAHERVVEPPARARTPSHRRSIATSCSTCSFQTNVAPRSLASVVFATRQPSCSGPMRCSTGTSTSSRKTSLNSLSPVIWRSGRTSTPFAVIGIASIEIPLCGGASGSVRTSAMRPVGEARVRRPHLLTGHDGRRRRAARRASRGRRGRSRRRAR